MKKSTKILGTYMLNNPFKNYYFVMVVSSADDHLTTFYSEMVAQQAKQCLSETSSNRLQTFMVQRS